jgi:precorrin-2 dehydrogenase/sirohydrochlorin ferrochelatase
MIYYPVYLDLRGRLALVVGGGAVAEGKTEQLVRAEARVRVISPDLTPRLGEMVEQGIISCRRGEFIEDDLDDVTLVISATDSPSVNERVAHAAAARGLLCNVVDQPSLCNFIIPAVITRGRLQISISTGGGSPSLAQRVKGEVAALIGEEYEDLLEVVANLRSEAHRLIPDYESRRDLLRAFVHSAALELLREGRRDEAEQLAREMLSQFLARRNDPTPPAPSPAEGDETDD